ncbi:sigma-70 family RNA polymerase sigma factor [Novosphingobium aquiterrae]|uniref:Sigma-70 family RNA polymerase sigma factor n=1 Tax=Novosphingobium aquiterrae TaxID=624388 RepID=A0ABV6PLJ9_9SPHN
MQGGDEQLASAEGTLRLELGREPGAEELAAALGIGAEELAQLRSNAAPLQFEPIDEAYSDSDIAFADERPDSFTLLADAELRAHLAAAIAELPERLQIIMQLYFVEEFNLTEIAAALQVSVPRIHQLKAQALERLRAALGDFVMLLP